MPAKKRKCLFSPRARSDLEDIWCYTFKTWSPEQADSYHKDIIDALDDLTAGRKVGRPFDIRAGYFKYPVGAHIAFYRFAEPGLVVIRILHRRMDVERHL